MTEYELQCEVAQYLRSLGKDVCEFTSIPNSTYTTSWTAKAKNTRSGLRGGLPDLLLIYNNKLLFIELKVRNNQLSEKQKRWKQVLERAGVPVYVCRSLEQIKKILKELNE